MLRDENEPLLANGSSYSQCLKKLCKNSTFRATVLETSTLLAGAAAATPFIVAETAWYFHPFAITSAVIGSNFFLRQLNTYRPAPSRHAWTDHFFRASFYVLADSMNRDVLSHEFTHAFGMILLFDNTHPGVHLNPPEGGYTDWNFVGPPHLTPFAGQYFNMKTAGEMVSAMGCGGQVLLGCGSLIAAQAFPDDYAELKVYLRWIATMEFLGPALYALSATWTCDPPGHDFCTLQRDGIPPGAAIAVIVGIAALVQLALSCCTQLKQYCASRHEPHIEEVPAPDDPDHHVSSGPSL